MLRYRERAIQPNIRPPTSLLTTKPRRLGHVDGGRGGCL
jgi:hypothetical protein